jgi:hypothetical protein
MTSLDEKLKEYAKLQGFDKIPREDRRTRVRELIDKGAKLSVPETTELTVLLLMGLGMNEREARQDVLRHAKHDDTLGE